MWFLNASSCVVNVEGGLMMGKEEICANQYILPPEISIVTLVWYEKFGLMVHIPEFFSERKYKACEFDN